VNGVPALVSNAETPAHATHILRHGAAWYRALGRGGAAGTKLHALSGDVLRPGLHELPMGRPLRALVFEHGGRMLMGRASKASSPAALPTRCSPAPISTCRWISAACGRAAPASAPGP
jgi:NADH:ubiquinone oxidoreductase subunit F (NADH-binding)